MKPKSLGIESLEQRTVLSASAIVALDSVVNANPAANQQQLEQPSGVADAVRVMPGDFNLDGQVDDTDIDLLYESMHTKNRDANFDLNGDELVDMADMDVLIRDIIGTNYGDATLDGKIDQVDAAVLILNMFTETSGWAAGDFTGDGVVDGLDFVQWNQYKFTETKLGSGGNEIGDLLTPDPIEETDVLETAPEVSPIAPVATPVATPVVASSDAQGLDNVEDEGQVETRTADHTTDNSITDRHSIRQRFARLRRGFR
jgi:hypothetical protein